jgi:predicted 3-demethylubiquinone-9 3-methyltransferase (glyoxalase superfamily)
MTSIAPCLWFDRNGEEAARFYVSLIPDSRIDAVRRYSAKTPGGSPGDVMSVEFTLAGKSHIALNGGPYFQFTPAMSLFVHCADQDEVDRLWDGLSEGGAPQRCGWLQDRYGVSWQIVPKALGELLSDPDPEKSRRVMEAMLQMTKIDVAGLRRASENRTAA